MQSGKVSVKVSKQSKSTADKRSESHSKGKKGVGSPPLPSTLLLKRSD